MDKINFGEALLALRNGKRVCRAGWNGKGMWLYLLKLDGFAPCIVMHTAQGTEQPGWLASQPDMLADDWQVV